MKRLMVMVLLVIGFASPMVMAGVASAASSTDTACSTLKDIDPSGEDSCRAADGTIDSIITLVLNLLSIAAGIIAVIMVIVSGFKYITSQGDANQISSSKQSLIYAITGMVVVVTAQFIVRFVLSRTS